MKWLKLFEYFGLQSQINNFLKPYIKKGLNLEVYPRYGNSIYLNKLFVPVELRGKGLAKEFMKDLITFADDNDYIITLSPTDKWGSSIERLRNFYYLFGFRTNKNKDYAGSMIRYPNFFDKDFKM